MTLSETIFIANVLIARRMGMSDAELAHHLAAEREGIRATFLQQGK